MTLADVPLGMHLKEEAGWNQLEADWRRLIELQPDGGYVAELDGAACGTVTTCRFGPVAWVAMMLVQAALRGRGIGRALMVRALEDLDARGVRSVRLDATPLGRPLYESLGFVAEAEFTRFQGVLPPAEGRPELATVRLDEVWEALSTLDRSATATDRGRLLRRIAEESPDSLRVAADEPGGSIAGYLMSRPGSKARQIGPCIALGPAGARLLADAARRYAGENVFVDVPDEHAEAAAVVRSWGLAAGRHLTRMTRGEPVAERREWIWASAGPEKG
jgi:GNAT superfamily N-acetyltransferase